MRFRTDGHVATIAGTREGKGVASVIPNLIANPGAVVVFDPKGENFLVTGRARRARGRKVYRLDPFRRTSAMSDGAVRSEEHTSELQSLMRISYAVFCLKNKIK